MKRAEKKNHLVRVAHELFNRYGYHAVGVDQIIAEAGVAKTTLYRHFRSKEDLIVAVLKMVDENTREGMREHADAASGDSPLLATFDYLEQWLGSEDFYGCPFICAAKEFCDPGSPVHREATMHKRLMLAYFEELARREGLASPAQAAEEINLLHEGAISVAQMTGEPGAARAARKVAARMLASRESATASSA